MSRDLREKTLKAGTMQVRAVQLLLAMSVAACAANPRPAPDAAACSGAPMVAVTNNSDHLVEVVSHQDSARAHLGLVMPRNREEFAIARGASVSWRIQRTTEREFREQKGYLAGRPVPVPNYLITEQYFCR